jgi:hypothetical protein
MEATDSLETLLAIRETQKTVRNENSEFRPGLDRRAGTPVQANEKQQVWCCVNLSHLLRFYRQRNYSSGRAAAASVRATFTARLTTTTHLLDAIRRRNVQVTAMRWANV